MNSLAANFVADFHKGIAAGTADNPALRNPIAIANTLSFSLASTTSGAGKADTGFGIGKTRVLGHSSTELLSFLDFANLVGEGSQSVTTIRFFYMIHATSSDAVSITAGGGANAYAPLRLTGTLTLEPGQLFIFGSPTVNGMPTSGSEFNWQIVNDDGAQDASYEVGFLGEV